MAVGCSESRKKSKEITRLKGVVAEQDRTVFKLRREIDELRAKIPQGTTTIEKKWFGTAGPISDLGPLTPRAAREMPREERHTTGSSRTPARVTTRTSIPHEPTLDEEPCVVLDVVRDMMLLGALSGGVESVDALRYQDTSVNYDPPKTDTCAESSWSPSVDTSSSYGSGCSDSGSYDSSGGCCDTSSSSSCGCD